MFCLLCTHRVCGQKFFSGTVSGNINFTVSDPWDSIRSFNFTLDTFSISEQVTLADYKEFMNAVKRDSGIAAYRKVLPDSSIMTPDDFRVYLSTNKYDQWPVAGVSWMNAMLYCKWKTITAGQDTLRYLYTLPTGPEWALASESFEMKYSKNLFSDWLMDAHDESIYDFVHDGNSLVFVYLEKKEDPNVMKRKRILGNNWMFKHPVTHWGTGPYFYSFEGSRVLSFRLVKRGIVRADKKASNEYKRNQFSNQVLTWWGLKI